MLLPSSSVPFPTTSLLSLPPPPACLTLDLARTASTKLCVSGRWSGCSLRCLGISRRNDSRLYWELKTTTSATRLYKKRRRRRCVTVTVSQTRGVLREGTKFDNIHTKFRFFLHLVKITALIDTTNDRRTLTKRGSGCSRTGSLCPSASWQDRPAGSHGSRGSFWLEPGLDVSQSAHTGSGWMRQTWPGIGGERQRERDRMVRHDWLVFLMRYR